MNILSLFDGISCGQVALNRAGIKYDNYFASEIKKHAIKITMNHYPNTIQLGSVLNVKSSDLPKIDLLIGGSPCQDFSILKKDRKGLEGKKSSLFYEYLRLLKELKPKYFLLENVAMKKESKDKLDKYLGVYGIEINSSLVSFQKRKRIYWCNFGEKIKDVFNNEYFEIKKPIDKNISFQDFKDIDFDYCNKFKVKKTPSRIRMFEKECPNITNVKKIYCLTCKQDRRNNSGLIEFDGFCRYLTTRELELAQTLPVGYTNGLTKSQSEDVLGDCWTVDVIAHIFKYLKG